MMTQSVPHLMADKNQLASIFYVGHRTYVSLQEQQSSHHSYRESTRDSELSLNKRHFYTNYCKVPHNWKACVTDHKTEMQVRDMRWNDKPRESNSRQMKWTLTHKLHGAAGITTRPPDTLTYVLLLFIIYFAAHRPLYPPEILNMIEYEYDNMSTLSPSWHQL